MRAPAHSHVRPLPLLVRCRAHIGLKLIVWIGLALGICIPYFGLQQIDGQTLHEIPVTAIDRAIPFSPGWTWAYVSLGLLVPIGPLLASTRVALIRYAVGLAWLCVACFVVFLVFPVAGPRPDGDPGSGLYAAIVFVDRPSNSLPSLHAGLTLYSVRFIDRVLGRTLSAGQRIGLWTAFGLWGVLILYSTLATKQHWLLDLPAGLALAWLADAIAWRRGSDADAVRETGVGRA